MSTHTGVDDGSKQTYGTAGILLMGCQSESEISYSQRYDKAAEASILTGTVLMGRMVNKAKYALQVKCEGNDCWVWTNKDLVSWYAATVCERFIKLLHSCNALICLPHSFLQGKTVTVNLHLLKSARQTVTHFLTTAQTQCQNATSVDHKFYSYFMSPGLQAVCDFPETLVHPFLFLLLEFVCKVS